MPSRYKFSRIFNVTKMHGIILFSHYYWAWTDDLREKSELDDYIGRFRDFANLTVTF